MIELLANCEVSVLAPQIGIVQVCWTVWANRSDWLWKPVRPVWDIATSPIGLYHCVDLVETIEIHI